MAYQGIRVAMVGPESADNIRLVETLTRLAGKSNVHAYLRLDEMIDLARQDRVDVIFVDLFTFDPVRVTDAVSTVRDNYRRATFVLYVDALDYREKLPTLPPPWNKRFGHYYRVYKQESDVAIDPIVMLAFNEALSTRFVRSARSARRDSLPPHAQDSAAKAGDSRRVFISYPRKEWEHFVSPLVKRLNAAGHDTWIDQNFIQGGSDWLDAIGQALKDCAALVLVVTPASLASPYVKMEYYYFFQNSKPIIPLMLHEAELPPVLSMVQYIDFTADPPSETAYARLLTALEPYK